MNQTESSFLTVSQVADELNANYQKVLYMIRTNKLPAKKEGKAFKIPSNYRELMVEKATEDKGRKKRVAKRGKRTSLKEKTQKAKKERAGLAEQELLVSNLAKAIQELIEFQVGEAMGSNKKTRKSKQ